jgi:hypothetical protein
MKHVSNFITIVLGIKPINVFDSTVFEAVMLVLIMEWTYNVRYSNGLRRHNIYNKFQYYLLKY